MRLFREDIQRAQNELQQGRVPRQMYLHSSNSDTKPQFSPFQVKDNIYEPATRTVCLKLRESDQEDSRVQLPSGHHFFGPLQGTQQETSAAQGGTAEGKRKKTAGNILINSGTEGKRRTTCQI